MTDCSKYDTRYAKYITCPWCGYEDLDSWEVTEDCDGWCDSCDRPIEIEVHVEVTYSTYKGE